jgi:hypothetical protein
MERARAHTACALAWIARASSTRSASAMVTRGPQHHASEFARAVGVLRHLARTLHPQVFDVTVMPASAERCSTQSMWQAESAPRSNSSGL